MAFVRCTACGYEQSPAAFQTNHAAPCPACKKVVSAILFPALYKSARTLPPALPEEPPAPGEAVCFYNPRRRATKVCDHCGVFISDSWAARWGPQTVCLKCLEQLRTKEKDTRFEAQRTLWDNIALSCAIGPFVVALGFVLTFVGWVFGALTLMLTAVTAPAAIIIALRYWKAPRSLVPRGPWRLVWALLLALVQLGAWLALGVGLYLRMFNL